MHWLWKLDDNIKADLKKAVFVNALALKGSYLITVVIYCFVLFNDAVR
jgi:hypothetical protein